VAVAAAAVTAAQTFYATTDERNVAPALAISSCLRFSFYIVRVPVVSAPVRQSSTRLDAIASTRERAPTHSVARVAAPARIESVAAASWHFGRVAIIEFAIDIYDCVRK